MTGDELRTWRQTHGYSQADLAHELELPVATISKWERGALGIRHPRVLSLALAFLATQHKQRLTKH
jgi:transcriptional regulator with XRE-family HTH domain